MKRTDQNRTLLVTFKQTVQVDSSYDKKKQKNLHKLHLYSCTDLRDSEIETFKLTKCLLPQGRGSMYKDITYSHCYLILLLLSLPSLLLLLLINVHEWPMNPLLKSN